VSERPANFPAALEIAELADPAPAAALFQRRFGDAIPATPHHVVARYRGADGVQRVACYIHFRPHEGLLLGGGACIDNRVVRAMPAPDRAAIHAAGGLYCLTLAWAVRHFAARVPAIFGYCGDVLAERADLAVGFLRTAHPRLLVYWTGALDVAARNAAIARVNALGPF
jgi:hypothetical protein